ncbi:ESCRT-II complex, vps25 subunit [Kalmanozyma brasiliensis GHG001]|uniref:ESCRT-II complex subunit VPS25 n=1 Tax=Kalmanozyma brasiliensis (strain GHG001) TaxID=1365824 RepID=V5ERI3_KALBG|nr:ESCRT-II complex, vps25 subunit [Kalmanozyma brasiliensis GHG001]EST04484.1 ESCRT-II complex, vps25 subunit [Kalmanozyma brasiliensis GHG001]
MAATATASASTSAIGSSYPSTSSSSSTAPKTFRYPPIHAFPPFYTLQHNPVSRAQQLSQWRALILDYCRSHRIFSLSPLPSASDASGSSPHKTLFANASIQRSLSPESIRAVLADLVEHKGAAWEDQLTTAKKSAAAGQGNNAKAFIYWKTPAQWGDAIYEWVMATGQNKSIMTLFELNQGELVESQDFYELPMPILKLALKHLSSQGKAQIFAGSEAEDGEGVKFV